MDVSNASRFLQSYNRIEAQLKLLYNAKATANFTDLVKRCSDLDITVRRYSSELIDYGKLRNAIVHRTAGSTDETVIAVPCDEVVSTIEFIEAMLCRPPRLIDAIKVKRSPRYLPINPCSLRWRRSARTGRRRSSYTITARWSA